MLYLEDDLDRISDREVEQWLSELPEQRRTQAEKIRFPLGRKQCVVAYRLLCRALREEYGIAEPPRFTYGPHGKPFLTGHPDIHFNLSHCRQAVACVVSDRPVGVDVETIGRCKPGLMEYVLSENEHRRVQAARDPQTLFAEIWTRKEALCKLTGEGIGDGLRDLLESPLARRVLWQTEVHAAQGFVCSVAQESIEN